MSTPPAAPVTVLVCALGGEGGGVLAEWLYAAAVGAGLHAQSTSIPGVAQRTGATTYYIEIQPGPAGAGAGRSGLDLDVVGGGPGALRHARDRGALRVQPGADGGGVQPLGQHPAALAAEGADEHGDGRGRWGAHAGRSRAVTNSRRRASQRSAGRGWRTISAR